MYSCSRSCPLLPPRPSPRPSPHACLLQTLILKDDWDAECEEYETYFPGFKANWEAAHRESWPDFYARMAATHGLNSDADVERLTEQMKKDESAEQ